jgi:putative ABC transport system permease protein
LFRFAISNAFRRKGIAIFAILGTALGIALMTVLLSISDGIDRQMSETMTELAGTIVVSPQDAPPTMGLGSGGTPLPLSYVEEIEGIEHVDAVSYTVSAYIPQAVLDLGNPMGVTLDGIDLKRDAVMDGATVHIVDDGVSRTLEGEGEIIVGQTMWDAAEQRGFMGQMGLDLPDIGESFTVPISPDEEVELTIVGIFETGSMLTDMSLYTSADTARELAGLAEDRVNTIFVRVDSVDNVEDVAAAIEERYEDAEVPVRILVAKDMLEQINEAMGIFHSSLWIISLVAAIAGGISIFIIMLISVIERTKEFGILKAAGWSNRNIISSVVVQSITVGLLGAAVGLAIGYAGGLGIDSYLNQEIAIITWRLVVIIGAFGVFMGVAGGIYPALRAARVSPVESLRAL